MALLELYRRQAGSCRVAPRGVVEQLDVVEDVRPGVLARVVDPALDPFALEQLEEALGASDRHKPAIPESAYTGHLIRPCAPAGVGICRPACVIRRPCEIRSELQA